MNKSLKILKALNDIDDNLLNNDLDSKASSKKVFKIRQLSYALIFCIVVLIGSVYAVSRIAKNLNGNAELIPTYTSELSTMDSNKVWIGTFNLVWNDFMDNVIKGNVEFINEESKLAQSLNKQSFKADQLSEDSYFKISGPSVGADLKNKIQNGIKEKFNEDSKIIDKIDWTDTNGYVLYAMLKKEFSFLEPFSNALESMEFKNAETRVKCFGVDSVNNPVAAKNVEILFYNSGNDFAIKLKTREGEEVFLYKTLGIGKTFEEIYQEIKNNTKSITEFGENDILRIPFIKVNAEINYDELCGKVIKNSSYYIKQAIQTIDFDLNNFGGSVKSEAVIEASQKSAILNPRKMIFDSDFVLFLKEENKEQPYFALKVDNIDALLQAETN